MRTNPSLNGSHMRTIKNLYTVFINDTEIGFSSILSYIFSPKIFINSIITPKMQAQLVLINKYMKAQRLASVFLPAALNNTGTDAPIPIPNKSGTAMCTVMNEDKDKVCTIPTDAEALCRSAAINMPIIKSKSG